MENLPYYPPTPFGWEKVEYPTNTSYETGPEYKDSCNSAPFTFRGPYHVTAIGSEVRNCGSYRRERRTEKDRGKRHMDGN